MREYTCTKCGNKDSTRWKLIKDEILCDRCHSPAPRRDIGRTDIEFEVINSEDSMKQFGKKE